MKNRDVAIAEALQEGRCTGLFIYDEEPFPVVYCNEQRTMNVDSIQANEVGLHLVSRQTGEEEFVTILFVDLLLEDGRIIPLYCKETNTEDI